MGELKPIKLSIREGAPVPLFSRLIDDEPHLASERIVKNLLSLDELKISIAQELEIILNTRISAFEENRDAPGIPDYHLLPDFFGLRDFSAYDIETDRGQAAIARKVKEAIMRFEPRLLNPEVTLLDIGPEKLSLKTQIQGEVLLGTYRHQVNFAIVLVDILKNR